MALSIRNKDAERLPERSPGKPVNQSRRQYSGPEERLMRLTERRVARILPGRS